MLIRGRKGGAYKKQPAAVFSERASMPRRQETGMEAFELRLWDGRIGMWLYINP